VYVDGPHHEYPERAQRDAEETEKMEDLRWTVARFDLVVTWSDRIACWSGVFGKSGNE